MNCPACGKPLNGRIFFCESCWWKIPADERAGLYSLHVNRQPADAKVARCVKLLEEKKRKS